MTDCNSFLVNIIRERCVIRSLTLDFDLDNKLRISLAPKVSCGSRLIHRFLI